MARTLFKEPDRYVETYWSKWGKDIYVVGDAAKIDEDGYFWIVGRTDDVINVSGHRMSTMEIESAIVSHDQRRGGRRDRPDRTRTPARRSCAFVTLEGGAGPAARASTQELREHVAKKIGKLARPKRII